MKFEFFVSQRLRLKNSSTGGTSPSIIIAIAGIAIAIVIMIIAIVVILGFKHEIREKIMGFDAQITVTSNEAVGFGYNNTNNYIIFDDSLKNIISSACPTAEVSLSLKQPGILKTDDNFLGVVFKGLDSNHKWEFISDNLVSGNIPNYACDTTHNQIIVSKTMSKLLKLDVGSKIYAYFIKDGNVKTRRFEIGAIYESHFNDYDKLIAFSSLPTLQKINDLPSDGGSCIELRGFKPDDIIPSSSALQDSIVEACYNQKLNNLCNVTNVYHTGAFYFTWLDLLDTNVVVILILIALVAGFTLVSCMFIIILERVNTIGILKALGATNAQIRGIFITLTERLVIIGMLIGNFIGITLTILQKKFHLIPLNPDAYYLNYVPVELNWAHILYLNLGVLVLTTLILVIPSQLVSTISPAKTIKYE